MNVKISTEHITLGQLLKHVNLVQTGGEAKEFISSNQIKVNDVEVCQRGKKIFPGDVVTVKNLVFDIIR